MTVVGPNRVYPDVDNLYLSLCEVAVYGGCPPLPSQAMQGTMSAIAAVTSESLGANCEITMGTETLAFLDAERACNRQGGHLASIHNEQEADYARALIANSPFAAQAEAWCVPTTRKPNSFDFMLTCKAMQPNCFRIGLNDRKVECLCHGDCFVWTDGTPNDFATMWRPSDPDDGLGTESCDDVLAGRRPPCTDDDEAMQAASTHPIFYPQGQTCASVARECPVAEITCGTLGGPGWPPAYAPLLCSQFIGSGNAMCSCSCPPATEDCTALTEILSAPDIGEATENHAHNDTFLLSSVCAY